MLFKSLKEIEEIGIDVTKYNISKIQLTSTCVVKLAKYKNKYVRLTGTFFGSRRR